MRVAFLIWTSRRLAGREVHAATVIPAFQAGGIEVAVACEVNHSPGADLIARDVPVWCANDLGRQRVVAELRAWRPNVLYVHGLLDPGFEAELLGVAPAVFFAHEYYGTCISGSKAFKFPRARPCHRRFGWQCLLHYYPHRCGGLSPFTMVRDFRRQSTRLRLLNSYEAVITHSRSMALEYVNHGVPVERVHLVPYCVEQTVANAPDAQTHLSGIADRVRLAFVGRMTLLKGGQILLQALPHIRESLGTPVHLTMVGDGPERTAWEHNAASLSRRDPGLTISFAGWLPPSDRDAVLDESDLLVVPSVWPEPFGLVGVEAGRRGVPAAAFAVGGIPEWLEDGVNGHLASGDPPTSRGLAEAVVKCLSDERILARLSEGARRVAFQHSVQAHIDHVLPILASVATHELTQG